MCDISQNGEGEKNKINSKVEEETIREIRGSKQLEEKSRTAGGSVSGEWDTHKRVEWCIKRLKESQLDIKSIFDHTEVVHLLEGSIMDNAIYEGRKRYENWLRKGGDKASKTSQYDCAEAYEKMALLDYLRRPIMDYYGFTGFDRTKYRNYMNALVKALKGYGAELYIKRAKELMSKFEVEGKYDEEVLHILTLLTLKFLVWYEKNKFQLIPSSA